MHESSRTPRFPLTAAAESTIEESGAKALARAQELSLRGCYLDSLVSVAVKSETIIKTVDSGYEI
jgi:hypothetical protein